jgi:hypothetical protein
LTTATHHFCNMSLTPNHAFRAMTHPFESLETYVR